MREDPEYRGHNAYIEASCLLPRVESYHATLRTCSKTSRKTFSAILASIFQKLHVSGAPISLASGRGTGVKAKSVTSRLFPPDRGRYLGGLLVGS